jgi:hypothetical protein
MKMTMKRMAGKTMKRTLGLLCALVFAACIMTMWASPPVGVTPTLIGRGTFDEFRVKSDDFGFQFKAAAKPQIDLVVRTNDYAPGASTGWHTHPRPVFITVTQGEVTFYEVDDPTCSPHVVTAGHGYVDTGRGHIGRNLTGSPARDVAVVVAPVGGAFRSELPAPGPFCAF